MNIKPQTAGHPTFSLDIEPERRIFTPARNWCDIWYDMIYDMIYDMMYDMIYDMIYLLNAIGLSPGGSSTVHIYTQTVHRMTQNKQYIE